jgi:tetratricopeptide (TPR) repeat protein
MMNFKNRILIFFVAISSHAFSQTAEFKALMADAESKLKIENYEDALEEYLQLVKLEPKNETVNYNTAVCYLNTNTNKSKAVPYLEIVVRNEKHNPNADFLLGRAYQFANRFDDAIASFEKFKINAKGKEENLKTVDQEIQHCINAKELVKFPIDVIFQNLGKNINSEFADYYPFVTENEAYLIYNTKRPKNKDIPKLANGQYLNSIHLSKVINGQYMESDVVGAPLCEGNSGEEVIGMNAKGDILLINKPNFKGESKLYMSTMSKNGEFSKLKELPPTINGSGDVIAATINNDATTIYFASDRKGGFGGTDIYMCNILPTGKWSEAKNMGKEINTAYDEDFPNLSPDGKTLYFSSKGHSSMGGYDIFKAAYNEETNQFEKIRNIGYPVNTSYDDLNFRISKSGRYGYVSSLRGGGLGDFDIYRVSFNDVEIDYTVVVGQTEAKDTTNKVDFRNTFITVNDNISNEIVGNYLTNPATGRFIIILPPGKYTILVESPGFKEYKYPIEIFDKVSYQSEISLNISLKK